MNKFRGKTKEGKKKVYGYYWCNEEVDKHYIRQMEFQPNPTDYIDFEVIPKSVGQFVTKDKNGKDVYAGDNIKAPILWHGSRIHQTITGKVGWRDETLNWVLYHTPNTPECVKLWRLQDIELIEDKEDEG